MVEKGLLGRRYLGVRSRREVEAQDEFRRQPVEGDSAARRVDAASPTGRDRLDHRRDLLDQSVVRQRALQRDIRGVRRREKFGQ